MEAAPPPDAAGPPEETAPPPERSESAPPEESLSSPKPEEVTDVSERDDESARAQPAALPSAPDDGRGRRYRRGRGRDGSAAKSPTRRGRSREHAPPAASQREESIPECPVPPKEYASTAFFWAIGSTRLFS
jgi:hypothetical protein